MAGQTVTIAADFTCSFSFDIQPTFTDYYIEVPVNNNGHEPPILLARRQPGVTPSSPLDQFTVQVSLLHISRLILTQIVPFRFHSHSMLLVRVTAWFWTIRSRSMGRTALHFSKSVVLRLASPSTPHDGRILRLSLRYLTIRFGANWQAEGAWNEPT